MHCILLWLSLALCTCHAQGPPKKMKDPHPGHNVNLIEMDKLVAGLAMSEVPLYSSCINSASRVS